MSHDIRIPLKRRTLGSRWRGLTHFIDAHLLRERHAIVHVPALDLRFKVGSDTIFSRSLIRYGGWEPENSNHIVALLRGHSAGLFVDVGANFGWFTGLFSLLAGERGHVVAIEPEPQNFALLSENVRMNALQNVSLHAVPVGERPKAVTMRLAHRGNPGRHSIDTDGAAQGEGMQLVTLDELLQPWPGRIALLKIDIEGYEIDALRGATTTLARCDRILVEYSPAMLRRFGHEPAEFFELIGRAGLEFWVDQGGELRRLDAAGVDALLRSSADDPGFQQDLFCLRPGLGLSYG
jgi:FkbM family methyltransferase